VTDKDLTVRRILVALDALPYSLSVLEAAADLAARFEVELLGLFVEDTQLLVLGDSPFAGQVSSFSASRRRLNPRQMERQLRIQTARMEQAFARFLERTQVQGSFRTVRGKVVPELVAATAKGDVLILGKASWSVVRSRRMSPVTRALLSQLRSSTLIMQQGTHLGLPVLAIYDGSELSKKALAAATRLAKADDQHLTILIISDDVEDARRLRAESTERLRGQRLILRYRLLVKSNVPRLVHQVHVEGGGMLVLPAKCNVLNDEALLALLEEVQVPTLLVR
jgi:nucleotide-binding universal stress UspA family protein